jgi:hypothetical protein
VFIVFQEPQPTKEQPAMSITPVDTDKSDFENKTPHKKFVSL